MISADELQLKAYLLGKLSGAERADVEDRYFADDGYFADLRALEEKLIRGYLRGQLDAADRDEFEAALARLPGLQKKVVRRALFAWTPLRLAATAAALLAVVLGAWSYKWQGSALRAAEQQVRSLQQELGRHPAPVVIMLQSLFEGVVRGESPGMRVPPGVTAVRFRLHLPPGEGFLRCRVSLRRTGEKAVLASSGQLSALQTSIGKVVDFDCPSSLLLRGDYTITLSPLDSQAELQYRFFSNGS